MRGHRDLRLIVALSIACAIVAVVIPFEAIRLTVAAPLCLVLPGYAVTAAIFASRRLDRGRLAVLALGMSLIVLVLCALLLNYVPGGIRDLSWALILLAVIVGSSRWAAIQRRPRTQPFFSWPRLRVSSADRALLVGAALAAVAALVVSARVLPADSAVGYTRLWMLTNKESSAVRIGVGSEEQHRAHYRLLVKMSGRVLMRRRLALDPGEERLLLLPLARTEGKEPQRLAASLYREGSPRDLYRRVTTWIASE
jgi:uncharacterized membrane protein